MRDGERRKLVFTNLANGLPVERIMAAMRMSEAEVLADFNFVCRKLRSYKFERQMPPTPCSTVAEVRANRVDLLFTLTRLNADTDPTFSKIETLPFSPGGSGGISEAERVMFEMQVRNISR